MLNLDSKCTSDCFALDLFTSLLDMR
uniref:Uncharacterized protein n=1 Tax=Anguilla anguilla TaxID=7936 RepID=A0A0E9V4W7_ANGAN